MEASSVSSACTSEVNSIGTAFHLIRSGLFESCLAGGTEAPLTSFTHKMLERAKVTSKKDTPYPLQSFGSEEKNKGIVLGEAAGICKAKTKTAASESQGLTGLSENADSLMKSINTSIQDANLETSYRMSWLRHSIRLNLMLIKKYLKETSIHWFCIKSSRT